VTCYQQSEVVLLALESVKYQILHYGQGQKFQLIAADDASTDGSQELIRAWAAENQALFARITLLFREKNGGICRNYVDALRAVEGERFVKVDGDDLLAPYNLFALTDLLSEYDMVCPAFLKFSGPGNLIKSYHTYLEVVLQEFIQGNTLRRAAKLGCPVMNVAIYRKSLLAEEVYDFILQFRTVNDRACFQKILTRDRPVKKCYVNRPAILYRISDGSISHFNSPVRKLHSWEIRRLCRVQREVERSPLDRFLLLLQEKSAAFRASPVRFVRLFRFFSPYFAIMLGLYGARFFFIRSMERELVDRHWKDCEIHYQHMEGEVADFLRRKKDGTVFLNRG